jgi:hypothetical protein
VFPPKVLGMYPVFVPRADADGMAVAGIHMLPLAVPRASYTGWNPRATGYGAGTLFPLQGAVVPFAATRAEREAARDPRLSLAERYADGAAYVAAVRARRRDGGRAAAAARGRAAGDRGRGAGPVGEAAVKVTPLGGIDGEFCPQDRALVFEDPNGTRILYDPGRTVAGATDPRLGKIDIILVSHMHGDHLGNAHNKAPNSGTCAEPDMSVSAAAQLGAR